MYLDGQIVWSIEDRKPVNCDTFKGTGKTSHFINSCGKPITPSSVQEAELLLKRNVIVPAPTPEHICWSCYQRKTDVPIDACENKQEHIRCHNCNIGRIYGVFRDKEVCRDCLSSLKKNALKLIALELLGEVNLIKSEFDTHSNNVSRLIEELVEFDDSYFIKRDSTFRERMDEMSKLYYNQRTSKTK